MEDFIGKYNGGQIDSRLDKVKDMVGATASQAGEDGLVPAPAKGDEGRFLCGDGTWKDVVVEPDYTVFDIVMEISSSGNLSISQENYNKLLEKLPAMLLIYFQSEIMEYTYQVFLVGIMLMMIILFGFI